MRLKMSLGRAVAVATLLLSATPVLSQLPPPPALPQQAALAGQLVSAIESKDLAKYGALLDDNLQVFEDGKQIARSKKDWIDLFGRKLTAEGVIFRMTPGFASNGRLLFIEYFNSMASWGKATPSHCCWSYDAVSYDIASNGQIVTIRRLRGGDQKIPDVDRQAK
ncbi:hypothetical protein M2336_002796 [Sphingobium sp. B1D7B]|uniref:hypothetical protein n=1 Tax=Sphingobium sp. B1D7B TaxID=2940578 RepID=UPI0022246752|nr:hypothetical protein [Sphingobium sp. B1D7B]MCW2406167.1 hypothetical protein [Sphingobium sp. B1D7B]